MAAGYWTPAGGSWPRLPVPEPRTPAGES